MHALIPFLFFFAQPFWQAKAPQDWTDIELNGFLTNSPWAQQVGDSPEVVVSLTTATPIERAEAELRRRSRTSNRTLPPPDPDFLEYLQAHRDQSIALAIPYPDLTGLGKTGESKRMEEETIMIIGKQKYHLTGHFPPTPSDPVLRLIFPRALKPTDKSVTFQLYLGGLPFPERQVEFRVKDLMWNGRLEI